MPAASTSELVIELSTALDRAKELLARLASQQNRAAASEEAVLRIRDLEGDLDQRDRDREELTARLVEAEHQLGRLMNLYVATFQLHATLDPLEVQATIAEIAVDLLGAERFALLLREEGTNECEVALARGLESDTSGLYSGSRFSGGDPLVDAALEDGVLRMGPDEFSEAIAVVPLRVQDAIVGVL